MTEEKEKTVSEPQPHTESSQNWDSRQAPHSPGNWDSHGFTPQPGVWDSSTPGKHA